MTTPAVSLRLSGTVQWFDNERGYGFVRPDDSDVPDLFVHHSQIIANGRRTLAKGQLVTFDVIDTAKGKQAVNVRGR